LAERPVGALCEAEKLLEGRNKKGQWEFCDMFDYIMRLSAPSYYETAIGKNNTTAKPIDSSQLYRIKASGEAVATSHPNCKR
jgi:hypothetical protein